MPQQTLSGQERTGEGLTDGVDTLVRILYTRTTELGGNEESTKKDAMVNLNEGHTVLTNMFIHVMRTIQSLESGVAALCRFREGFGHELRIKERCCSYTISELC